MTITKHLKLELLLGLLLIVLTLTLPANSNANDFKLAFSDFECPTGGAEHLGCWSTKKCIQVGVASSKEILEISKEGHMRIHVWHYNSGDCHGPSVFFRSNGNEAVDTRDSIYITRENTVTKGDDEIIYNSFIHSGSFEWEIDKGKRIPKGLTNSSMYHLDSGKLCFYPEKFSSYGAISTKSDGHNVALEKFNAKPDSYGREDYFFSEQYIKDMNKCMVRVQ